MKQPDAVNNWMSRHRNPTSFWLHMLGIPACFLAMPVMLLMQQWVMAAVMFVGGYALQFAGHVVEGNRSGEEIMIRDLLERRRARKRSRAEGPLPMTDSPDDSAGAGEVRLDEPS